MLEKETNLIAGGRPDTRLNRIDAEAALQAMVPAATAELEQERLDGPALSGLGIGLLPIIQKYVSDRSWGLEDPEALSSMILSRVLARLHLFDPAKGSLIGWAFSIAKNAILDELRDRHASEQPAATVFEQRHKDLYHRKERPDETERGEMLGAILALSAEDQYLLHLTLVEKIPASEAAAILGLSPEAVRKRKERLLKQLTAINLQELTVS